MSFGYGFQGAKPTLLNIGKGELLRVKKKKREKKRETERTKEERKKKKERERNL